MPRILGAGLDESRRGDGLNAWPIIAALVLAIGTCTGGYFKGRADNEATHTAAALAEAEARAADQARILAAEQKVRLLNQALEDQAYAEPVQSPACLPRSRVLRLQKYAAP